MKINQYKSPTAFEAKFIPKDGVKEQLISSIEKYWAEINASPDDCFSASAKEKAVELMEGKAFDANAFYSKVIGRFEETTKDFQFTVFVKKNEQKPSSVEIQTVEGNNYSFSESRKYPIWLFVNDFFDGGNHLLTKVAGLLDYNESGSKTQQAFNDLWMGKIIEERNNNFSNLRK